MYKYYESLSQYCENNNYFTTVQAIIVMYLFPAKKKSLISIKN